MANRLANATSPYLLQHADNPVDWWEWEPEAFAEAEQRDLPVFLSVGYAACHWCHVMAHESFEDDATAAYLNEHFVCVKVDREERPDVDAVFMAATQALTGQGGWPMSVFLTPGPATVLRRHLLSATGRTRAAVVRRGAGGDRRRLAGPTRRGAGQRRPHQRRAEQRHAPRLPGEVTRRGVWTWPERVCSESSTRCAAGSAARRSSHRRWCSRVCCASATSSR